MSRFETECENCGHHNLNVYRTCQYCGFQKESCQEKKNQIDSHQKQNRPKVELVAVGSNLTVATTDGRSGVLEKTADKSEQETTNNEVRECCGRPSSPVSDFENEISKKVLINSDKLICSCPNHTREKDRQHKLPQETLKMICKDTIKLTKQKIQEKIKEILKSDNISTRKLKLISDLLNSLGDEQ